jgi:hypothetical protein
MILRLTPALSMCAAFGLALGLALTVLTILGTGERGMHVALLATARFAFLFFLAAYAGGALRTLFGPRFQPLQRYARELGLAFAAALLVHLGLVARLYLIGDDPLLETLLIFGPAAAATYLLALLSIGPLQRAIGPRAWRIFRVLGLNYVAYVFALDFLRYPLFDSLSHRVVYLPFAGLIVAAVGLYVAAFAKRLIYPTGSISF